MPHEEDKLKKRQEKREAQQRKRICKGHFSTSISIRSPKKISVSLACAGTSR
jgi:hypothetical protein